ncbi:tetratricopeptide repeat protein [Aquitalea sp. LB_tupeE]|uniref:tetratricopeptide repeat protein n=1 Tax=Aquitalea sp. LB_tupeE TaxID=2748078 RepID=UPI0015B7A30B|nr:tetratricopeptide repeat protein [Aquitalea sp. LB_tupeE]NWK78211.1 tetratricopeptide repeat protein [Aquitalea sp. LB_tupeE]
MNLSPLALRAAILLAEHNLSAALQAAQACLQAEPDNAPVWNLLGVCAARLGQGNLAEQCWQQALQLDASVADAHYNLGCLYAESGQPERAEQHYRAELQRQPDHPASLGNLACLLADGGRPDAAQACWEALLRVQPQDVDSLAGLAQCHQQLGKPAAAEVCWEALLQQDPHHLVALNNLALLYQQQGGWQAAADLLQRALQHSKPPAEIWLNQANGLLQQGKAEAAHALLQQGIAHHPAAAVLHDALGMACSELGQADAAEQALRMAVQLAPQQPRFRQNLGYLLLSQQRWDEGWPLLEARLQRAPGASGLPQIGTPCWQGEALAGRHLLVWFEQGLGDALQFCRYLPLLQPARLTVVCRPELLRLLQSLPLDYPVHWLAMQRLDMDLPAHDCHVFAMSLPRWLVADPAAVAPACFVMPPTAQAVPGTRLRKLGLVWRGNALHPFDHHRSLPDVRLLQPLLALPGIEWTSLQLPVQAEEQQWLAGFANWQAGENGLDDLADAAAVLGGLDGLVTVDTALAHLAGSLGLPTWLLLSGSHTDWRWGWQGETSVWYPAMRLRRQQAAGDWAGLIHRLAGELARYSA